MKQSLLEPEEVLFAYDAVSLVYPHILPMCIWRAWEYSAYQRYELPEPVLDVGCGNGLFFRLVWPQVLNVIGVDVDVAAAKAARQSRVYHEVLVAPAHLLPMSPETFSCVFANCSLEHMDHLPEVLSSIYRSLRPGGTFLLSVVTDKFLQWTALPLLADVIDEPERAQVLQADYEAYHHLVNPLPPEVWAEHLIRAGFEVLEHIPIVPEMTSRLFLFLDQLWHVRRRCGEVGDMLYQYLMTIPNFTYAFREVFAGILRMERDWSIGSGAIFAARRSN